MTSSSFLKSGALERLLFIDWSVFGLGFVLAFGFIFWALCGRDSLRGDPPPPLAPEPHPALVPPCATHTQASGASNVEEATTDGWLLCLKAAQPW